MCVTTAVTATPATADAAAEAAAAAAAGGTVSSEGVVTAFPIKPSAPVPAGVGVDAASGQGEPGRRDAIGGGGGRSSAGVEAEGMLAASEQ